MVQLLEGMSSIAGFTYDADIWCVECTEKYVDEAENSSELEAAAKGENDLTGEHVPHPVFRSSEWTGQPHCSSGKECVNATVEHGYRHDLPVGKPIRCNALDDIEESVEDPEILDESSDELVFAIHGDNFSYQFTYDTAADELTMTERSNKGTLESRSFGEPPAAIADAANEVIAEGKAVGAL